jgi:hypothetical protein
MKITKFLSTALLFAFLGFGLSTVTSCSKKGCTDETSDNFDSEAEEDDDSCNDPRDKFVATYNVVEAGADNYTLAISKSSVENRTVILSTNFGFPVAAFTLNGSIKQANLTVASQTAAGATFAGTGSLSGSVLTLSYSVTQNGVTESFVATATKQ